MMKEEPFKPSDLPLRDGKVYHLDLKPEELAKNIILVGDPARVSMIASEFLKSVEVERFNRGLRTITGTVKETGQRVSIVTSGMGTPSMEIVLNELVALNEIDFQTLKRKTEFDPLTLIRVGTTGGVQRETVLGTLIITDYIVGLDNTGLFYDAPCPDSACKLLEDRIREAVDHNISPGSRFKGKIFPYGAKAHSEVVAALETEAQELGSRHQRGVTVTSSGFFGNEGRAISRVPLTVQEIDPLLATLETGIPGLKIENLEMEASFLLHFMGGQGYKAGAIYPVIDKRCDGTFLTRYDDLIREATQIALRALFRMQGSPVPRA